MESKKEQGGTSSQIRQMKLEREQERGNLVKFGSKHAVFDSDFYNDSEEKGQYLKFIPNEDEGVDSINPVRQSFESGSWRDTVLAQENPELFKQELASHGGEYDPFKYRKHQTVQDREGSYRSQWRERRLSPPRQDPFAKTKTTQARTYKEIMRDVILQNEKKTLMSQVKETRSQTEEKTITDEERRKIASEMIERAKAAQAKQSSGAAAASSAASAPPPAEQSPAIMRAEMLQRSGFAAPAECVLPAPGRWVLNLSKNGVFLAQRRLPLTPSTRAATSKPGSVDCCMLFGRNDVVCDEHTDDPSCSRIHAILVFLQSDTPPADPVPNIYDNGSTNKTFVNGNEIPPRTFTPIKDGDVLTFGSHGVEYKLVAKAKT